MNKKAVANLQDPIFYGIVGAIWLVCNVVMWKLTWFEGYTKVKILFTIVSLPVIFGLSYIMGQNG